MKLVGIQQHQNSCQPQKKYTKFNIQQNLRTLKSDENEHQIEYINESQSKERVMDK
jgi:hypothetical protein